jgi:aminoglycoside 6'-N-acetyltransferase
MVIEAERQATLDPGGISFRALQTGDLVLLHCWLANPRVFRWYGGAAPAFAEVEAKYTPRLAGQAPTKPCLILHAAKPIGYIQTYLVATDPYYAAIVGDSSAAAAIDIFIGEDEYAGRGLGAATIRAFLRKIIFSDLALDSCYIDPHPDNSVAIRAYTRAGFRPLRRVDPSPPKEPCLLMCIDRAAFEGS